MHAATHETVLITGAAGFIGYHLANRLLDLGYQVIGIDNLNPYYDVTLKEERLMRLSLKAGFNFALGDICDREALEDLFRFYRPTVVVNLAAQAGVRYSMENPHAYIRSNLVGFANVLEMCRHYPVRHLLYASSSSVYGGNIKVPFEETDPVDHPVSLYAATKRSNELLADCYAHLYKTPTTGLRFFTVYGPYGRPDMAYYSFADSYFANEPIHLFNNGDSANDQSRDFTYVDDVVESVVRLLPLAPGAPHPHEILNVGGSRPEQLTTFVATLESAFSTALGRPVEFQKVFESPKPGDVHETFASAIRLERLTGFKPSISLAQGLQAFADWYVAFKCHETRPGSEGANE